MKKAKSKFRHQSITFILVANVDKVLVFVIIITSC